MCTLLISYQTHPDYPLIIAANRDEFYERPTSRVDWWKDHPELLAGRDLKAGGTWMGISRSGRFSSLTNHRDPRTLKSDAPTRGNLVTNYILGDQEPGEYLQSLKPDAADYNGYNLLAGDTDQLWHYSNVSDKMQKLEPGIYGLSNALLDTPWPKVVNGKENLAYYLEQTTQPDPDYLFDLLRNPQIAPDEDLPDTGIGLDWERKLSALFIEMPPKYGTRVSTVLMIDKQGKVHYEERAYVPEGEAAVFTFETKNTLAQ